MKGTTPSRGSWILQRTATRCHDGLSLVSLIKSLEKGNSMNIITVGIDLAKHIFAVHGVDQHGKAVLVKPRVARDQLLALVAQLPPLM